MENDHILHFGSSLDLAQLFRVVSTKNIHAPTLDMSIGIRHKVVQVYQISRDIFYSF